MIDFPAIRNVLVKELATFLSSQVVMLDQAHKKPPLPFLGYKVTTPYAPERGGAAETDETVPSANPDFEYDIERTATEQPTMTISFTAYADTEDEAVALALQAQEWVRFSGYDTLSDNNMVVVETTAVQNRDTLLVDDYERRQGFDVILRVTSQSTKRIDTLEQAIISRKE